MFYDSLNVLFLQQFYSLFYVAFERITLSSGLLGGFVGGALAAHQGSHQEGEAIEVHSLSVRD